jgi:hypothetical protein
MYDDIFFLSILIRALGAPQPKKALEEAFKQIEQTRTEPQYQIGYHQFQRFIREVVSAHLTPLPQLVLRLDKEGGESQEYSVTGDSSVVQMSGILPGHYHLFLDTGLLLWEGDLTVELLLHSHAHPGEYLPLAADTGDFQQPPSGVIELLQGELLLHTFPGLESGTLEVRWFPRGGGR